MSHFSFSNKKVLTLNQKEFEHITINFYLSIEKKYSPDIIIFIKNGGLFIKKAIHGYINNKTIYFVKVQRPSTKIKNNLKYKIFFKKILHKLPYFILDRLRILEHFIFINSTKKNLRKLRIKNFGFNKNILIFDDAVDSGITAKFIFDAIIKNNSSSNIRLAALTQTTNQKNIKVDYLKYKNILIRFPWSLDYKYMNDNR